MIAAVTVRQTGLTSPAIPAHRPKNAAYPAKMIALSYLLACPYTSLASCTFSLTSSRWYSRSAECSPTDVLRRRGAPEFALGINRTFIDRGGAALDEFEAVGGVLAH